MLTQPVYSGYGGETISSALAEAMGKASIERVAVMAAMLRMIFFLRIMIIISFVLMYVRTSDFRTGMSYKKSASYGYSDSSKSCALTMQTDCPKCEAATTMSR